MKGLFVRILHFYRYLVFQANKFVESIRVRNLTKASQADQNEKKIRREKHTRNTKLQRLQAFSTGPTVYPCRV